MAARSLVSGMPESAPADPRPAAAPVPSGGSLTLAKHKFGFEKRQRELNKERKRAEKQQRKLDRANEREPQPDQEAEPTPPGQ